MTVQDGDGRLGHVEWRWGLGEGVTFFEVVQRVVAPGRDEDDDQLQEVGATAAPLSAPGTKATTT